MDKIEGLLTDKELFDIANSVEISKAVFCHILPPEVYRYRAVAKAQFNKDRKNDSSGEYLV